MQINVWAKMFCDHFYYLFQSYLTAENIVIAVGCRPTYPSEVSSNERTKKMYVIHMLTTKYTQRPTRNMYYTYVSFIVVCYVCLICKVPGAVQYGITSDDLFSLKKPPGKT